jgi:hypothetical protein
MDRNTFLKNALYLIIAGITFPKWLLTLHIPFNSHKEEIRRLLSNLDSGFILNNMADEMGKEYLSMVKGEISGINLFTGSKGRQAIQKINLENGLPPLFMVQEEIKADFESNRLIRLRGWVLSETEAMLCAYYNLTT